MQQDTNSRLLYNINLPCKFPQIFVIVVYIHPKANQKIQ